MKPNFTDDPEPLLSRARTGDQAALGNLLELYRSYLALLARVQIGRRLRGKADASDLVQETFLADHRDFARFRGATEPELASWLREILAMNLAALVRRYYGTKRRNIRLERELADELGQTSAVLHKTLLSPQDSPSELAAEREEAVLLANALGQLPSDYREVIVLRHLEELSFPEVARRMNRSLDSVKKLWIRALPRLRRVLRDIQVKGPEANRD